MNNKANYRKKDGQRLTISEYKQRRKKEIAFHLSLLTGGTICFVVLIVFLISKFSGRSNTIVEASSSDEVSIESSYESSATESVMEEESMAVSEPELPPYCVRSEDADSFFEGYEAVISDDTTYISSENVKSTYAILVSLDTGNVVASKEGNVRINPASMTKILTLLVAAEHIQDLDDTFTMTQAIGDFTYTHDCSQVGFEVGETVTIKDLMYGTILPSGGDAAMCLAEYVAGSQEAFVDMMNAKLSELGLSDTAHFTNCIGIFNQDHYCTLLDMAMILKAAEENALCREILNTRKYTTTSTEFHPEGITISNWFMRRIEDKDTHGEVMGAKTGFVAQSGCCGASYQISADGSHYICVTADAWSSWRCIYDHVDIYDTYTN